MPYTRAITDAGLLVQLDLAALNPNRRMLLTDGPLSPAEVQKGIEQGVEIINQALRDMPKEQVLYHH